MSWNTMVSWAGCNLLKRLELKISKHTVIQNSSSIRFMRSTKSDMKTWWPIIMRPLSWQRSLRTSTLTIYHISKMRMQTHWRPSLLHWPFQPEPRREYLSRVVNCTIENLSLKTVKLQEETFKSKRFLRLQQVSNLKIGDSLTSTSSYMAYCVMIPRTLLPSEENPLILLQCDHANIVPPIVWRNPTPMPFK